jgi:hypothetical protein
VRAGIMSPDQMKRSQTPSSTTNFSSPLSNSWWVQQLRFSFTPIFIICLLHLCFVDDSTQNCFRREKRSSQHAGFVSSRFRCVRLFY